MRPLIISALAATLTGCTWFAPQQAQQAPLSGYSAAGTSPNVNAKTAHPRYRRKADSARKIAKMDAPLCVEAHDKSSTSKNAESDITAKTEAPKSSLPDDKSDPVIRKAMPSLAAKMENSASIELVEMKRAEKNELGRAGDTICGYVRGKSASGSETGERPFLYLVQEDEAYIGGYNIATSPYHNLCDK